jgi:hypothetical protein
MTDRKNNQAWEEHKNQTSQTSSGTHGSKGNANTEQNPDNRLKDGTNDFQNGDQDLTSERSSDLDDDSQVVDRL